MEILPLNPLPTQPSESSGTNKRMEMEGFVDEAVVRSVVMKGAYERIYVKPEEMVLSSSEDDYAGWALPVASPFRDLLEEQAPAEIRQPAPPMLNMIKPRIVSDSGIDQPYTGTHRWWLFGISGAMTCAILSLTLLSLAQRVDLRGVPEDYMAIENPGTQPVEEPGKQAPAIQRTLTTVIGGK